MGFCFTLVVQSEPPLVSCLLCASDSFSRMTLCPLLIYLPILVHMTEIWAIFLACRPDIGDPRSLLYWFGVQLIGWWRHRPVGPNAEGHASGLRSFAPPPFSQSEQLEGTFPAESGGDVAPLPPRVDIHLETYPCPCNAPFLILINPLHLPTPWWQGFYHFYLHSAIQANCDN